MFLRMLDKCGLCIKVEVCTLENIETFLVVHFDLFQKNFVPTSLCQCGEIETSQHYPLECRHYNIIRNNLFENIENLIPITLDVLLFENESLTFHEMSGYS